MPSPYLSGLLRAVFMLLVTDLSTCAPDTASVGKLRSSAELAFSKGEIEQALSLWEQVNVLYFMALFRSLIMLVL